MNTILPPATAGIKTTLTTRGPNIRGHAITSISVNPQGTVLYGLVTDDQIIVFDIGDNGTSLKLRTSYSLPNDCQYSTDLTVAPDGNSLILQTFFFDSQLVVDEIVGCRVRADDGTLETAVAWPLSTDKDTNEEGVAWVNDSGTGDVYILSMAESGDCLDDAVHLMVWKYGSDSITHLALPQSATRWCIAAGENAMSVQDGHLYLAMADGVYRYNTSDLLSPPVQVLRSPDDIKVGGQTWAMMGLVPTADLKYWWVADRQMDKTAGWPGSRYSLYTADFSTRLTSIEYISTYSSTMRASQQGYILRLGAPLGTFSLSWRTHSMDVRDKEVLLVDPSMPRQFSQLWQWPYFWATLSLVLVTGLVWIAVRRHERTLSDNERIRMAVKARLAERSVQLVSEDQDQPGSYESYISTPLGRGPE